MRTSGTPSSVWQRRTHRLVAAAVIFIGLTMMISNITQCIYMGMVFIMVALIWLAWMTMKERKTEPPRSQAHQSPVLFLVTSHMLPSMTRSNTGNPLDKPPSYDTIVSLDGLPPDYSTVQLEKPPRYEEIAALYKAAKDTEVSSQDATPGPSGLCKLEKDQDQADDRTNVYKEEVLHKPIPSSGACETGASGDDVDRVKAGEDLNTASQIHRSNFDSRSGRDGELVNGASSINIHGQGAEVNNSERSGTILTKLHPMRSSLSRSFRTRRDSLKVNRERKRNASGNSAVKTDGNLIPSKSLLRLQVPTLHQDISGSTAKYLECQDFTSSTVPSVHSPRFTSTRSRTLPNTRCGGSSSEANSTSTGRTQDQNQSNDVAHDATTTSSSSARQLSHSSSKV